MGLAQEDAAHRVWQTADGAASLSIEAAVQPEGGFEALLMDFRAQARQMDVRVMEDVRRFSVLEEGAYTLCGGPRGQRMGLLAHPHLPGQSARRNTRSTPNSCIIPSPPRGKPMAKRLTALFLALLLCAAGALGGDRPGKERGGCLFPR